MSARGPYSQPTKPGVAEPVELVEQERIVQLLAGARLVARGTLAICTWPMIGISARSRMVTSPCRIWQW